MLRRMALICAVVLAMAAARVCPAAGGHGPADAESPGAAAHATAGAHGKEELLSFDASRVVWTIIIFVILLAILYPTAWKQVLASLKEREERIRRQIDEAESARARAEETLRQYREQLAAADREAQARLAEARAQADHLLADMHARAQKDAEEMRGRAAREIEEAKVRALAEIYERVAELSAGIAEKILRRSITPADHADLVRQSLERFQAGVK